MKKMLVGLAVGLLAVVFLVTVGYAQQKATKRYSVATGGTSGTFYYVGAGMAAIAHKYMPGVAMDVESTSASPENARLVSRHMADFGLTTTEHSYTAYMGTGQYGKEEKGNIRMIRNSHSSCIQLVTNDPKIKTGADLRGKRVAFGAPGSTTYMVQGPAFMKAYGMTYKDCKAQALHYNEAIEAMKDGNLDATMIAAGVPTAAIIDLFSVDKNAHFVQMTQQEVKKMQEFDPYCFPYLIKAGTYKGLNEDVLQTGLAQVMVVHKDIPNDVVYNLTKFMDQNVKELYMVHGVFKDWSHEVAMQGIKIPFHPGAEKYWKEIGVIK